MKKISIFISEGASLGDMGVVSGISFLYNLLKLEEGFYPSGKVSEIVGGRAYRFFDGCHHEALETRKAIMQASEVKGVFSLAYPGTIKFEISLYKGGENDPFFVISPWFYQETGEIASMSYQY